jgi:hypothetical protein
MRRKSLLIFGTRAASPEPEVILLLIVCQDRPLARTQGEVKNPFSWGEWRAREDDFRTFLDDFVIVLPQIELPSGLTM